jgi:hypothetical protein
MSIGINELTRSFLGKDSLNDCSKRELLDLATEFPFSSTLTLLLAKKTTGDPEGADFAEKASLYFPDPLWLDILLKEKGTFQVEKIPIEQKEPTRVFEPAFTAESTVAIADSYHPSASPATTRKEEPAHGEINTLLEVDPEEKDSFIEPAGDEKVNGTPVEHEDAGNDDTSLSNTLTPMEAPLSPALPDEAEESILEDEPRSVPEVQTTIQETINEESNAPSTTGELPANEKKMEWKFEPVSPGSGELSFEPFHTVDYFASQGIKFSEEEKPKDKFGQQLKSFTEWLKLLKQPQGIESIPATPPADQKVEKLAEHSLADREVLTEAMAQVWEKQGNRDKALAIYKKLSLLNPSKSSYFAAKIELLKKS